MKIRCFSVFMLSMSFVLILILASCSAMAKSPISLLINVKLDDVGDLVFSGYHERISHEDFLRRDLYILSGLHVAEDSCVHGECDRRVWEVVNSDVFSNQPLKEGVELPATIVYGQSFSKLKEVIKAKPLKQNMPYFLIIGIMGINKNLKDKIYFSTDAHFMFTKDKNGVIIIKQSGKNGISLKRVIIK